MARTETVACASTCRSALEAEARPSQSRRMIRWQSDGAAWNGRCCRGRARRQNTQEAPQLVAGNNKVVPCFSSDPALISPGAIQLPDEKTAPVCTPSPTHAMASPFDTLFSSMRRCAPDPARVNSFRLYSFASCDFSLASFLTSSIIRVGSR